MAYSETLDLVAGDTLPELTFTLKDSNKAREGFELDPQDPDTWELIDLTGCTVRLRLRQAGSSTVTTTLTCTVSDAEGGECITDFSGGGLTEAGIFEGELEVTFATGGVQTVYDLIRIRVREDFD
jgi:hypothetical protein